MISTTSSYARIDYSATQNLVLGYEFDQSYGDPCQPDSKFCVCFGPWASVFWKDVLLDLQHNPPQAFSYLDVCGLTGPGLLSRDLSGKSSTLRPCDARAPTSLSSVSYARQERTADTAQQRNDNWCAPCIPAVGESDGLLPI